MSNDSGFISARYSKLTYVGNMSGLKTLINLVLVVVGSWVCFYGALHGIYYETTIIVVALLLAHIAIVNYRVAEACIIIMAGIVGSFVEMINSSFGFYHYIEVEESIKLLPTWIILFWFLVGSTARHGLAVFYRKKILLPLIGGVGATIIYFAGSKSGVLHFAPANKTAVALSIVFWALAIIFILLVGNRFVEEVHN